MCGLCVFQLCFLLTVLVLSFVLWNADFVFFFFKQKTAYEMRISDWSSDVCSSDLDAALSLMFDVAGGALRRFRVELRRLLRPEIGAQIGRASCRERVCQYV